MAGPVPAPSSAVVVSAFAAARRRERERLSRILHDDLGQLLTASGLELDLLKLDHPGMARDISRIQESLDRVFSRVRELSQELEPDPVSRLGFPAAFERLIERTRSRLAATLHYQAPEAVPPSPGAVYDVAECALDNVARHSGCRQVSVELRLHGNLWRMEIRDDGAGFDLAGVTPGSGLLTMAHSAAAGRLDLRFKSSPGHGTLIQLTSR